MCLPIAGRVIGLVDQRPGMARVRIGDVTREVNLALLSPQPLAGEWVLVHLGFAVERVSSRRAAEVMATRRIAGASA